MPIAIQCPSCKTEYKVDDKLLGKKVKCRECGDAIVVAPPEAQDAESDVLSVEEDPLDLAPEKPAGPSMKRCPSCRTPTSPGAAHCGACGYDLRPAPAVVVETIAVAPDRAEPKTKKRRFVRDPGSPTLNSLDSLINLVIWWGCIAALAVWIVHLARSATGLSAAALLPIGVVIVLGVLIIAPLMTIAIKVAARFVEFLPRHDTYNRVLLSLLLPFGASLLSGWPGLSPSAANGVVALAWLASPALFIYLFRAEIMEWGTTVGAACVALAVGWLLAGVAVAIITSLTGPLYAESLPNGPWLAFATGHAPAPPPSPAPAPAKAQVAVAPASPIPASPGAAPGPDAGAAPENPIAAPATVAPGPSQQVAALTHQPATHHEAAPSLFPPTTPETLAPTQSSFFAELQADDQDLQNIREISGPFPPAPWMLVIKGGGDGDVTVERYGLQPLTKKGTMSFRELPQQPNSYTLSPMGNAIVALVHFPKNQLQIASFDNKIVQTIPLPNLAEQPSSVVPTLMGFLDQLHVCVCWPGSGQMKLQVWDTYTRTVTRLISPEPFTYSLDSCALSPNGRWLATLGHGPAGEQQILIYNMDTGAITRRISPTSSQFKPAGLAFSPDNTQIALCAVLSNVTTLLSFQAQSGAPVYSGMLATPAAAPGAPRAQQEKPPGLLWLQNGLAWLVAGNDLYDCATGKKFGALNLPDVENVQLAGSDSILIQQRNAEGGKRLVVAKFDDVALKTAIKKAGE